MRTKNLPKAEADEDADESAEEEPPKAAAPAAAKADDEDSGDEDAETPAEATLHPPPEATVYALLTNAGRSPNLSLRHLFAGSVLTSLVVDCTCMHRIKFLQ